MRPLLAFLLIGFGVLFLGVAVTEAVWMPIVDPRQTNEFLRTSLTDLLLASSGLGFLMVLGGVIILWRGGGPAEHWRPYTTAMSRLAAEHGQAIAVGRGGFEFVAFRDGQRIQVSGSAEQELRVRGAVPGRQNLSFVRTEDARPDPTGRSQIVGGGRGWQLRAELPAIARTLLSDVVLISMMDRYFAHVESLAVAHTTSGVEVVSRLPSFDQSERRARQALDIVAYLRRVNG